MVLGHLQTIHFLPKENGVPTDRYPRRGENTESKRERLGPSLGSTTWSLHNPTRATPCNNFPFCETRNTPILLLKFLIRIKQTLFSDFVYDF